MEAKKSLGQHWLNDEQALNDMVAAASVEENDYILEVGPGHGSLTRKLLANGAQVTAVEKDESLAGMLERDIKNNRFRVLAGDILEFNLSDLPKNYKVVANIPYYLTSRLIRNFCESANPAHTITLLVQKEVAERICALPGQMSLLSVSSQIYYDCELGPIVLAEKFDPPPKVDSQIVIMRRKLKADVARNDNKFFFRVVKAGFSSRRKTLLNTLSANFSMPKDEIANNLQIAGLPSSVRAQELSISEWLKLCQELEKYND